jgi:hypothetical protein
MWNTESDADESFRKKVIWGSAAVVVLGLVGAAYYYKYHGAVPAASQRRRIRRFKRHRPLPSRRFAIRFPRPPTRSRCHP